MVKLNKALNVANILNQHIVKVKFEGDFYQAFGEPQNRGVWFAWGGSGSGKSTFVMQLAKEFCKSNLKCFHNLCEEETDDSEFVERTEITAMSDVKEHYLAGSYNYEQLCDYLDKRNSPEVVVIDSGIYFFKSFEQYLEFKKKYKRKILIISGHAQGSQPRSELEKSIMYDAKKKIFVSAYLAACKGRTIGPNGGIFIIWKEGFEKVRGEQKQD